MVSVRQLFLQRISPRGEMKDDSSGVVVGGICAFSDWQSWRVGTLWLWGSGGYWRDWIACLKAAVHSLTAKPVGCVILVIEVEWRNFIYQLYWRWNKRLQTLSVGSLYLFHWGDPEIPLSLFTRVGKWLLWIQIAGEAEREWDVWIWNQNILHGNCGVK